MFHRGARTEKQRWKSLSTRSLFLVSLPPCCERVFSPSRPSRERPSRPHRKVPTFSLAPGAALAYDKERWYDYASSTTYCPITRPFRYREYIRRRSGHKSLVNPFVVCTMAPEKCRSRSLSDWGPALIHRLFLSSSRREECGRTAFFKRRPTKKSVKRGEAEGRVEQCEASVRQAPRRVLTWYQHYAIVTHDDFK
jgi:hypothetical protein